MGGSHTESRQRLDYRQLRFPSRQPGCALHRRRGDDRFLRIFGHGFVFLLRTRGGLVVATIGASVLFASVSGSAVASATTMSVVAVPEMRKYGYNAGLSAACAAVGGTLGALIPPSAVLVLYDVLTEEPICWCSPGRYSDSSWLSRVSP